MSHDICNARGEVGWGGGEEGVGKEAVDPMGAQLEGR